MSQIKKIVWAEGVLLGQQHFQQWDKSIEGQFRERQQLLMPNSWGLLNLHFDEVVLKDHTIRVTEVSAMMPNGELVHFDSASDGELVCQHEGGISHGISLYLCMPSGDKVEGITGYQSNDNGFAWKTVFENVKDVSDPDRIREVMFRKPKLSLVTDENKASGMIALKIAEIEQNSTGSFRLKPEFIPASLHLAASKSLNHLVDRCYDIISAKVKVLRERRQDFNGDVTEFGHNNLAHFLLLQEFSRSLPFIEMAKKQMTMHPQQFFNEVVRLCASLTAFSEEVSPETAPDYQHDNLSDSFKALFEFFKNLVDSVMPAPMSLLKLNRDNDLMYSVESVDMQVLEHSRLFVSVNFPSDNVNWIETFTRQVKIGARSNINSIVATALPGVRLTHTQRPPSKLPIKTGHEYFLIESAGEYWDEVKSDRSLALFLSHTFINAKLEILTVQE